MLPFHPGQWYNRSECIARCLVRGERPRHGPHDSRRLGRVATLEKKLAAVYRLHGKEDHFRSVLYKNTGHEYLPEMKAEMVEWFEKHLPVGK